MLKSKRFGTAAPDINLTPPEDRDNQSTPQNPDSTEEGGGEEEPEDDAGSLGKGKQVQR